MSRRIVAAIVGGGLTLAACGGGAGTAKPFSHEPACAILADLAVQGEAAAHIDVADPDAFKTQLRDAVTSYVRAATSLRAAVPARLQDDVDRIIAAAQQHQFTHAQQARADLDAYARQECKTST